MTFNNDVKVLQVIDKLDPGGAERVFLDLSNMLKRNGVNVTCLFLLEKGKLASFLDGNIPSYELKRRNKFNPIIAYKCFLLLSQYDIIHCHMDHVYRYIRLISLFTFRRNKIILHEHSPYITEDTIIPFMFNSLLQPIFFIAVAQAQIPWARKKLGIIADNIFFNPNSVIVGKKLQIQPIIRKSDIVLVGNIKNTKNQVFAVKLAKELGFSLNIIGNNQDENYYRELKETIASIDSDVTIYEGFTDVSYCLSSSRIGLSTSMHESGPLVLIEYLAMGIPFLTYNTGEVAKLVSQYFPEFTIDNFEIEKWSDRVKLILERNYTSKELVEFYEKHFSPDNYYARTIEIYSRVCAS